MSFPQKPSKHTTCANKAHWIHQQFIIIVAQMPTSLSSFFPSGKCASQLQPTKRCTYSQQRHRYPILIAPIICAIDVVIMSVSFSSFRECVATSSYKLLLLWNDTEWNEIYLVVCHYLVSIVESLENLLLHVLKTVTIYHPIWVETQKTWTKSSW